MLNFKVLWKSQKTKKSSNNLIGYKNETLVWNEFDLALTSQSRKKLIL